MKKKIWNKSEIEIIAISAEDVITTSPSNPQPGGDNYEGEIDW